MLMYFQHTTRRVVIVYVCASNQNLTSTRNHNSIISCFNLIMSIGIASLVCSLSVLHSLLMNQLLNGQLVELPTILVPYANTTRAWVGLVTMKWQVRAM